MEKKINNTHTYDNSVTYFKNRAEDTFSHFLGLEYLKCEPGYCLCRLPIKPEFNNVLGGLHGGVIFSVADTASGAASIDLCSEGVVTTFNSNMQFLQAALKLDEIYAEAKVVKDDDQFVFTDVEITTKEGTILSKGSFIFAKLVLSR